MQDAPSEIADHEVFLAINENREAGVGFTAEEARTDLLDNYESNVIRTVSVRVRARAPVVELGPEIDIADKAGDIVTATMLSDDPAYAAAQKGTTS